MITQKINHWNENHKSEADIVKGESIRIRTTQQQGEEIKEYDVTFKIGDTCEEGSYNLTYFGTIVQITEKSVIVKKEHSERTRRFTIEKFCWRNYKFDLAKATVNNADTMQRI